MLNSSDIQELLTLAAKAAQQAGQYIAQFDHSTIELSVKAEGYSPAAEVVTQVDIACEALIQNILRPSCERFNFAFLGEESASEYSVASHPRLTQPYFWCVDPLDGTLPFTENKPGYSVSIALVSKCGEPVLGVVYEPLTQTLYQAVAPKQGIEPLLLKNGQPWHPISNIDRSKPLALFFDRSFTTLPIFSQIVDSMRSHAALLGYSGIEIQYGAGSVMNAIQMLEHSPACYFKLPKEKPGGGSLWDFAATAAITLAAGMWVSDIHGNSLLLNASDSLFMNRYGVLYASEPLVAKRMIEWFEEGHWLYSESC